MLFPHKRYRDIQGWVPEVDVDGVDVKDSIVSDCENIDFENAFMKNAIKPQEVAYPIEVDVALASGYDLLASKYFSHETRGDSFFYVLYKFDAVHLLKFFVKDETDVYELNIDEQNSNLVFDSKPTKIKFALAENQFKINLNINATYTSLSRTVICNLTLTYLLETKWVNTPAPDPYLRTEGWYLFPRWLGWSYDDISGAPVTLNAAEGFYEEDWEDTNYIPNLSLVSGARFKQPFASWVLYVDNNSGSRTTVNAFGITNIQSLKKVVFKLWSLTYSGAAGVGAGTTFTIRLRSNTDAADFVDYPVTIDHSYLASDLTINCDFINVDSSTYYYLTLLIEMDDDRRMEIDDFRIYGMDGVALISKNVDGQRSLVGTTEATTSIYNKPTLEVDVNYIDWRTSAFELYIRTEEDGVFFLVSEFEVKTDDWILAAGKLTLEKMYDEELITTTLIFNYGLGAEIKVYTIDEDTELIGDIILSEAYHKARTYYVKGTHRVLQSHISGTGRGQPDSFPFSIENQFGFFETFKSEKNFTVSVTPQDELAVGTRRKAYVYFIQGGQGVILRILKAINGGQSVIGSRAMLSDLEGQPEATVLAWYNEEGLYLSPGGRREPQDVIKASHKNYWLARTDKEEAIFFFNKAKKEIWIAFPNREVMIYELDFNKWKKYKYDFAITNFIGNVDNDLYVLGDDDKMYKIDFGSSSTLTGFITTHYSSGTLVVDRYPIDAPEHELKVLQELFVAWNKRSTGIFEYTIIADGNTYDKINILPNNFTDLVLAPQLVVWGKIKIKLKIPAVGAWVREFGYSFSVIDRTPGQAVKSALTGIGMNTGLELGVHQ